MFYERLEAICLSRGMTVVEACVRAGIHRSTHSVWKRGGIPSDKSLFSLASVLCTTVSYLRGDSDNLEDSEVPYDVETQQLLEEFTRMTKENRKLLLQYASVLNQRVKEETDTVK